MVVKHFGELRGTQILKLHRGSENVFQYSTSNIHVSTMT